MTETEARKAFNTASTELQTALTKYQGARTALHRITGEFVGADQSLSLRFSSACAGLPSADNNDPSTKPQHPTVLADC